MTYKGILKLFNLYVASANTTYNSNNNFKNNTKYIQNKTFINNNNNDDFKNKIKNISNKSFIKESKFT